MNHIIFVKCGCYIGTPNEQGNTIPYFCDEEMESWKGCYYVDGQLAEHMVAQAKKGVCLTKLYNYSKKDKWFYSKEIWE